MERGKAYDKPRRLLRAVWRGEVEVVRADDQIHVSAVHRRGGGLAAVGAAAEDVVAEVVEVERTDARVEFVLDQDADDFDEDGFRRVLAKEAGVDVSQVNVTVIAGSVVAEVTIRGAGAASSVTIASAPRARSLGKREPRASTTRWSPTGLPNPSRVCVPFNFNECSVPDAADLRTRTHLYTTHRSVPHTPHHLSAPSAAARARRRRRPGCCSPFPAGA